MSCWIKKLLTASQELRYDWEAELSGTGSRSRVEFL